MNKPTTLPHAPGVYQFLKGGTVLYVGKAKNLASRVGSYFGMDSPDKARRLVAEADRLETTLTHSETEALLLEQALIQKHLPEYNVVMKEGVRYAYLLLQKKPFRLRTVRRQAGQSVPKGKLYGPFAKGSQRWEIIRLLRLLFFEKTGKPFGSTDTPENQDAYDLIEKVLDGKADIRDELERRMNDASKEQHYEKALRYRNRLAALDALEEHQSIEQKTTAHQDIIGFVQDGDRLAAQVFRVRWGVLREQEKYAYETIAEDPKTEFVTCYYATHEPPREIIVRPESLNALTTLLPQAAVRAPKAGTAAELLSLAEANAQRLLATDVPDDVVELQKALHLRKLPRRIEGFDISTLQGNQTVAAMVSFHDGKADKDNYRYFNIHTAASQAPNPMPDDYAAMKEAVFRRYHRLAREKQPMPDLVLIDGGKGQLNAAMDAFEQAGVRIPICALAKEFEEIYVPERSVPVRLPRTHAGLKVLQRVRDEVHRFVIGFHRRKRGSMPID